MKMAARIRRPLALAARLAALGVIALYRALISPLIVFNLGPACRFSPTCSEYASQAIAQYGVICGVRLAFARLMRCRPMGGFGYDPVPHDLPAKFRF